MVKKCSVENCDGPVKALGLCYAHYMRQYRRGTTDRAVRKYRDITGKTFGNLTVVRRTPEGLWLCRCDCGVERAVHVGELNRGSAVTCGIRARHRSKAPSYHTAHRRVDSDKGRAKTHACVDCGEPAQQWSYTHDDPDELIGVNWAKGLPYSAKPEYYIARCISCHKRADLARLRKIAGSA